MAINDKEIKRIIKNQETYIFRQKFPGELKEYLYDQYGEDPWPYEFSTSDLYSGIKADAREYFMGKLTIDIKPPLQKARMEIEDHRDLYGKAMCENRELQNYIDELHELLWSNGLEGSRMLRPESGIHEGTYAEYCTLRPELFK